MSQAGILAPFARAHCEYIRQLDSLLRGKSVPELEEIIAVLEDPPEGSEWATTAATAEIIRCATFWREHKRGKQQ